MSPGTYEFGSLIDGGVLAVGDGYRAKNDELGGDGPIFLRAGHVGDGVLDLEGSERFRNDLTPRLGSKASRPGDVLVVTKGWSTGRVAYVGPSHPPMVYSPHTCFWRSLQPEEIDPAFLRYWSRGHEAQSQLASFRMATDVHPYLSLVAQRKLRITIPAPSVQRAAGRILGALDDKIELNRRTNETLEAMARAIFRSWFVDFDPVRAQMEGRQPEGMDAETAKLFPSTLSSSGTEIVPAGWDTGPVTALQSSERYACVAGPFGSNLTSRDYVPEGVPVIRGANLTTDRFWMQPRDFVFVSDAKADQLTGNLARPGDVVLTQRGTLGQVGVIPEDSEHPRYVLSQSQMKITVDRERGSAAFVALYFQQPSVIAFIIGNGQQAGVPHVNLGFLRAFKILLPPAPVLQAFERAVRPLFIATRRIEQQTATVVALRDALLPKLLSGELRVPDAERSVSAVLPPASG